MVLKRKRSDSEISRCSSILSSPSSNMMSLDGFQSPDNQIATPSLFSSRTRKRHRDNRPSEEDVHQHTLSLLFSAQQNPQQFSPQSFQGAPISSLPTPQSNAQQSNLHSFWAIPQRQSSPSNSTDNSSHGTPIPTPMHSYFNQATNCEDCDSPLASDDDMDVDVMMDIDSGNNFGCSHCGKAVCSRCAVSNLGTERKCLTCAGNERKWVGTQRMGFCERGAVLATGFRRL